MNLPFIAVRAMRTGLKIARRCRDLLGRTESRDMSRMIPFYRRIWSEAADMIGADFREISADLWEISLNGRKTVIHNFRTALDNPVVLHQAGDKVLTYRLLSENGLPVPEHIAFRRGDVRKALDFMRRYPDGCFIVKPAYGTSGSAGVTTHIRSIGKCLTAIALASLYHERILIERQIFGETFRLLILDGKPLHATKRKGLIVVGDGRSTIRELLKRASAAMDDATLTAECACQGLKPESIPAKDRKVMVRAQVSSAGIPRELRTVFTDDAGTDISEALWQQASRAAAALDVTFAGVDIITVDPAVPLEQSHGAIIEINTTPGLHHHYRDGRSLGQPPTVVLLEHLLQHAQFGRRSESNQQ